MVMNRPIPRTDFVHIAAKDAPQSCSIVTELLILYEVYGWVNLWVIQSLESGRKDPFFFFLRVLCGREFTGIVCTEIMKTESYFNSKSLLTRTC